jgi:hypothetical protein
VGTPADAGIQTPVKLTRAWSVGMLKVHSHSSILTIVDAERSPDRKLRWAQYPQNSRTSKFDVARIDGAYSTRAMRLRHPRANHEDNEMMRPYVVVPG